MSNEFKRAISSPEKNEPTVLHPLEICYIAIENCPFIVDLPIENGVSIAMLVYQRAHGFKWIVRTHVCTYGHHIISNNYNTLCHFYSPRTHICLLPSALKTDKIQDHNQEMPFQKPKIVQYKKPCFSWQWDLPTKLC